VSEALTTPLREGVEPIIVPDLSPRGGRHLFPNGELPYVVREGDGGWNTLAKRFNLTMEALRNRNPDAWDASVKNKLDPFGQSLMIPMHSAPFVGHTYHFFAYPYARESQKNVLEVLKGNINLSGPALPYLKVTFTANEWSWEFVWHRPREEFKVRMELLTLDATSLLQHPANHFFMESKRSVGIRSYHAAATSPRYPSNGPPLMIPTGPSVPIRKRYIAPAPSKGQGSGVIFESPASVLNLVVYAQRLEIIAKGVEECLAEAKAVNESGVQLWRLLRSLRGLISIQLMEVGQQGYPLLAALHKIHTELLGDKMLDEFPVRVIPALGERMTLLKSRYTDIWTDARFMQCIEEFQSDSRIEERQRKATLDLLDTCAGRAMQAMMQLGSWRDTLAVHEAPSGPTDPFRALINLYTKVFGESPGPPSVLGAWSAYKVQRDLYKAAVADRLEVGANVYRNKLRELGKAVLPHSVNVKYLDAIKAMEASPSKTRAQRAADHKKVRDTLAEWAPRTTWAGGVRGDIFLGAFQAIELLFVFRETAAWTNMSTRDQVGMVGAAASAVATGAGALNKALNASSPESGGVLWRKAVAHAGKANTAIAGVGTLFNVFAVITSWWDLYESYSKLNIDKDRDAGFKMIMLGMDATLAVALTCFGLFCPNPAGMVIWAVGTAGAYLVRMVPSILDRQAYLQNPVGYNYDRILDEISRLPAPGGEGRLAARLTLAASDGVTRTLEAEIERINALRRDSGFDTKFRLLQSDRSGPVEQVVEKNAELETQGRTLTQEWMDRYEVSERLAQDCIRVRWHRFPSLSHTSFYTEPTPISAGNPTASNR